MNALPTLYHYTCADHIDEIRRDGLIKVHRIYGTTQSAVWMTDLATPDRKGLGLTSNTLRCDRTAHRLRVIEPHGVMHWNEAKRLLPRSAVEALEGAPGALPMHWWVSGLPQRVEEALRT